MSLPALQETILAEARKEADAILARSRAELAKEQERATSELRAMEERIVTEATKNAQRESQVIHQRAELAGRASVLTAKQEEIDATKAEFLAMLQNLPEQDKKKLYASLKKLLPDTEGKTEEHPEGGFIFRGKGIEVNLSFPYLTDRLFWKYRAEISQALFG